MKARSRTTQALLAGMLITTLAAGGTTAALGASKAPASGTTATRVAHGLNQVPWASVGPQWLLADWTPHPHAPHPYTILVLVSPSGAMYDLFRVPLSSQVVDWSGDGRRVLLTQQQSNGGTLVRTVDLHTGATLGSFGVPETATGYLTAAFSKPLGREVLVSVDRATHTARLTRYTFGGTQHTAFPVGVSGLGRWTNSWVESRDGNEVVIGYNKGLGVFSNDGALIARLGGHGLLGCQPTRFFTATVVIAHCSDRSEGFPHVFEFQLGSATPTPLTEEPHGSDLGNTSAWQVGSSVYVQQSVGCGPSSLDKLVGNVPVDVDVPAFGVGPTEGDVVVGATASSLAVESQNGCTGQNFLAWFTPSSDSVVQVLGAPLSPGEFGSVVAYPSPWN